MHKFSARSLRNLASCHNQLQSLFHTVIIEHDCAVLCGHRGKDEQDYLFALGRSQLQYPRSKHNTSPSSAVDVVPWPLDWQNIDRFIAFGESVKIIAEAMKIKIIWGGDWKTFKDYPHFELDYRKK